MAARAVLALCVLAAMLVPGCLGTSTTRRCVDEASSSNGQAVLRSEGATFQYSDPQGLVNSNWRGRGEYVITVDNAVVTQTLKGFTHGGNCPIIG